MIDFTKEDLWLIVDGLTSLSFEDRDKGKSLVLRAKVISMIDNYCEHEWELSFSGCIISGIYCQKCAIKLKGS